MKLRTLSAIFRRELYVLFVSPLAYLLLGAWTLLSGWSFYLLTTYYSAHYASASSDHPLSAFFGRTSLFYVPVLIVIPLLSMRLIAEERQRGTFEMLRSAPASPSEIVLGKYLAALVFWMALWLPTLAYPWLLRTHAPLDLGALAASYLGVFLLGAAYLALGLWTSTWTRHQLLAALLSFALLALLFAAGLAESLVEGSVSAFLSFISVWNHMDAFARGLVDSRTLGFYLTLATLALMFSIRRLEKLNR